MAGVIYHLAPLERWEEAGEEYFPATYDQDGFVHATKDPEMLMDIANHFYKLPLFFSGRACMRAGTRGARCSQQRSA